MRGAKFHSPEESRSLIICLTSYGNDNKPATVFEWEGVTSSLSSHRIFLRDLMQHWYLGPLLDFSVSYADTLAKIKTYIDANRVDCVALIGSSMGGFAAMKMGSDLGANLVLAFSPQTCLDATWRGKALDARWPWKMTEIAEIGYGGLDLRHSYAARSPSSTVLFYDPSMHVDRMHARHLAGLPGVELAEVAGGHHVATPLAKAGEITRRLKDFEDSSLLTIER